MYKVISAALFILFVALTIAYAGCEANNVADGTENYLAYNSGHLSCISDCYARERTCQKYAVTTRDLNECWNDQQRCVGSCNRQYSSGSGAGKVIEK